MRDGQGKGAKGSQATKDKCHGKTKGTTLTGALLEEGGDSKGTVLTEDRAPT